jgi:8-oxo-dGTP diphosphatase
MSSHPPFSGAKVAILCNGSLLTYQRDDKPEIPWPNLWDLPGGGREGDETPEECAVRETMEEFGIVLDPASFIHKRVYAGQGVNGLATWFFVAEVADGQFDQVVFGDEGQRWQVMTVEAFLAMDNAVDRLQHRLRQFMTRPG